MKTVFKAGYGFWDTTSYPYGGDFKRFREDIEITPTGAHLPGKHSGEFEATYTRDGKTRRGVFTKSGSIIEPYND